MQFCVVESFAVVWNSNESANTFLPLSSKLKGLFKWPDGAVYDGEFVNGQREGHGKYTFSDGGQYNGSWKDGRYDGFG